MTKILSGVFTKSFLISILIAFHLISNSQTIKKYYNDWEVTSKEKAVFYAEFVKQGNVYRCTSYWIAGNHLRGRSTYPDTLFENPIGLQTRYFKNGRIEDSIFYEEGKLKFLYHFYPNKQLAYHYEPGNKIAEGYDENGKKIKNYTYEREAEFKGGSKEWLKYLQKNTSKDITVKGKGVGEAAVEVKFIIDEEGNVTNPKIFKSSGYKQVDSDAIRVISESPAWRNAIQYNTPVKALRIQPFKYTLKG